MCNKLTCFALLPRCKSDICAVGSGDSHLNLDLCTNSLANTSPHPHTTKEKTVSFAAFATFWHKCGFMHFFFAVRVSSFHRHFCPYPCPLWVVSSVISFFFWKGYCKILMQTHRPQSPFPHSLNVRLSHLFIISHSSWDLFFSTLTDVALAYILRLGRLWHQPHERHLSVINNMLDFHFIF